MTKTKERPMGKKRFLDTLAKRLFAYSLLKRAFIDEPSKELLALLIDEDLISAFPFQEDNEELREGAQMISFCLKDPDVLSDRTVEELIIDFNGLFIAPGPRYTKPWESVYTSRKHLLFQDETLVVRNEYAKLGLLPERFRSEADDHIGLELDFMMHLCDWSSKAFRKNDLRKVRKYLKAQKRFVKEHFLKWIPELSAQISKKADTDFYRGLSKLLIGFLTVEKDTLDTLVKHINLRIAKEKEEKKPSSKLRIVKAG